MGSRSRFQKRWSVRLRSHRRLDRFRRDRQRAQASADRIEDGVADRRGDDRHRRFATADRRLAVADDGNVDVRDLAHSHRRIAIEVALLDAAVFHRGLFEHGERGAPEDRALDLRAHPIRVDDGADVHRDGDFLQRHLTALGIDMDVRDARRPGRR